MEKYSTALVLATYLITFLGVVAGIVAGLQGYLVNKQKDELERLKNLTAKSIENIKSENAKQLNLLKEENTKQLNIIIEEREKFRHELLSRLITADRLAMVNDICGKFIGSASHSGKSNSEGAIAQGTPHILHDYHDLQSNLLTILSNESAGQISAALSDLGGQIACYGKEFDRSVFFFLNELWVQGFFHQNGTSIEFSEWYQRHIGQDGPILSKINRLNS